MIDREWYFWSNINGDYIVSIIIFGCSSCGLINLQLKRENIEYALMVGIVEGKATLFIDQCLLGTQGNLETIFVSACIFNLRRGGTWPQVASHVCT